MCSFEELFATYLNEKTVEIFSGVNVYECKLNSNTRSLNFKLFSKKPFAHKFIPSSFSFCESSVFIAFISLFTEDSLQLSLLAISLTGIAK